MKKLIVLLFLLQLTSVMAKRTKKALPNVVNTKTQNAINFLGNLSKTGVFQGHKSWTQINDGEDLRVYKLYGHNSFQQTGHMTWLYHFGFYSQGGIEAFTEEGFGTFQYIEVADQLTGSSGLTLNGKAVEIISASRGNLHIYVCANQSNILSSKAQEIGEKCSDNSFNEFDFKIHYDGDLVLMKRRYNNGYIKENHTFKGR